MSRFTTNQSSRDHWLAVLAAFALVLAVALAGDGHFDLAFWVACILFTACLFLSRRRQVLITAALLFLSLRLLFAFAISGRNIALVLGLIVLTSSIVLLAQMDRH